MYLVAGKPKSSGGLPEMAEADAAAPAAAPGGKWETFPNSHISHHGAACCDIAHEWLIAFDFAQLNGGDKLTGPRWLRERSTWGPSAWPVHWCEVVGAKVVDCGVHAALAQKVFAARGVPAFRAQYIQRYSADAAAAWREQWSREKVSDHWIEDDAIYHEGNAVLVGEDTVKLWDGSAGWWLNPRGEGGYGSLAAVRIEADPAAYPDGLRWGERRIEANRWVRL
jgi:hypothetical protein